jgi:hypothetical protein
MGLDPHVIRRRDLQDALPRAGLRRDAIQVLGRGAMHAHRADSARAKRDSRAARFVQHGQGPVRAEGPGWLRAFQIQGGP